jgi:hypothetical protein
MSSMSKSVPLFLTLALLVLIKAAGGADSSGFIHRTLGPGGTQSSDAIDQPLFVLPAEGAKYGISDPTTAVGSQNNLYLAFVTGKPIGGPADEEDPTAPQRLETGFTLIKYRSSGETEWTRMVRIPGADFMFSVADMAVDDEDNVYLIGTGYDYANRSLPSRDHTSFVIKLSAAGKQQWLRKFDLPPGVAARPWALSVDNSIGRIYVTGETDETSMLIAAAYDRQGELVWRAQDTRVATWQSGVSAIDADGNLVVAAMAGYGGEGFDLLTVKYDRTGKRLWAARHEAKGDEHIYDLGLDRQNNIYVVGYSLKGGPDFGTDNVLVKYSAQGKLEWERRFAGFDLDFAGMGVSADGQAYLAGTKTVDKPGSDSNFRTVKHDANGGLVWTREFDGSGNERRFEERGQDRVAAVATDSRGNIIVTGSSLQADARLLGYTTIKYDPAGEVVWIRHYDGPGKDRLSQIDNDDVSVDLSDTAVTMIVDGEDNVYVTGWSYQAGPGTDGELAGGSRQLKLTTVKYAP